VCLILDDRGVTGCAYQRAAALEFRKKALVINLETKRPGGGVKVGAINEERDSTGIWSEHMIVSIETEKKDLFQAPNVGLATHFTEFSRLRDQHVECGQRIIDLADPATVERPLGVVVE